MKLIRRLLWLGAALSVAPLVQAGFTSYGAGNISDTINPAGYGCTVDHGTWIHNAGVVEPGVSSCDPIGAPTPLYPQLVAPASNAPTMTHRWWGSVSFFGEMTVGDSADAAYITPDPVTARVSNRGARILSIPAGLQTLDNQTVYQIPDPFSEVFDGIAVGNTAYSDMQAYLKEYSDGSVTVQWRSGATPVMEATFVYGSPYAYFRALAGQLAIRTKAANGPEKGTFHQDGNSLGLWTDVASVRNNFLLVGDGSTQFNNPTGSEITVANSSTLTVAWLPQTDAGTVQTFAQYAAQPVDEVFIDYAVNRGNNSVTVSHNYRYQGAPVNTLAGMMPLQWKNSAQPLSGYKARSARGVVQFAATSQFSYQLPFVGVLPYFPGGIGDYDTNQLQQLVQDFIAQGQANWNTHTDTYWSGKNYGKVAELAAIARSEGMAAEADQLINWLKAELEDWFRANTSGSLDTSKYFVYDSDWNTLLGFDESFGAQQQLNDHHFHYGYFVRAAAEICRVDAGWCGPSAWGPMVELLIRDYAGGRSDSMFPYLRNFDPANGFSWASGHANFVLGNNNESTSEAANAYGAIVLYGLITGDDTLVDRGIYLHTLSTAAYWEYWNNLDRYRGLGGDYDNFAAEYDKMTTSIIWGNGHVFSTWFSGAYAHILGIQGLPLSPLVLHIGQHPDYLQDYVALGMSGESSNGKPSGLPAGHWRDVWWNIWAMTDGQAAVNDFNTVNFSYTPEEGETKAHTYHWVHTFKELGHLASGNGGLSADYPAALAFDNNGQKTYLAYNFGGSARTVHFSDGTSFSVPAGQMSINGSGSTDPDPEPGFEMTLQAEDYTAMTGVQTETTSDSGGGLNVGWIDAGDWMAYANITLPEAGSYRVEYRVASESSGGRLSLDINAGSAVLGELDIPVTGGWQNWSTVSHTVQMPAGPFDLGVFAVQGGWNINWIRIVKL